MSALQTQKAFEKNKVTLVRCENTTQEFQKSEKNAENKT